MSTPSRPGSSKPRHYFLNEAHELLPGKPEGGGRFQPFQVDWKERSTRLFGGFRQAMAVSRGKLDPTRDERLFLVTMPEPDLVRASDAVDGRLSVQSSFAEHNAARSLQRLGFDLLQLGDDGAAIVHARADTMKHLLATTLLLDELPDREKATWARVGEVRAIERARKVD